MGSVPIPTSEEEVLEACERALRMAPAPAWYLFEHEPWPIGESIRHA